MLTLKPTYPALILAFSAKFFGLYNIKRASFAGITGLFTNVLSRAPSNERLCIDPGDNVPLALKTYGEWPSVPVLYGLPGVPPGVVLISVP